MLDKNKNSSFQSLSLERAKELLIQGEVVGIPTETVYGLAAKISSDAAIRKIFSTKKRPFFDPLIVHVQSIEQAQTLTQDWPASAQNLAEAFWPGPLTLVLPKVPSLSDLITSGLPTVGLRMPRHPLTLELIQKVGEPLAAPSANLFGQTSPSKALHVFKEFHGEVPVLEGGDCEVGIESTIIKIHEDEVEIKITVLRAGHIRPQQIVDSLKPLNKSISLVQPGKNIEAPGQIKHHYMPSIPLVYISIGQWAQLDHAISQLNSRLQTPFKNLWTLPLNEAPEQAARELYGLLRDGSENRENDGILFVYNPEIQQGEAWEPLLDRLRRAASYCLTD